MGDSRPTKFLEALGRLWSCSTFHVSLVLLPILLIGFFAYLSVEKDRSLADAERHSENVAKIFQENTEKLFHSIDSSLQALSELFADEEIGRAHV